jgi:hypothetical protein
MVVLVSPEEVEWSSMFAKYADNSAFWDISLVMSMTVSEAENYQQLKFLD